MTEKAIQFWDDGLMAHQSAMIQALFAISRETDESKRFEDIKRFVLAYDPCREEIVKNALKIARDAVNCSMPRFQIWPRDTEVEIKMYPIEVDE